MPLKSENAPMEESDNNKDNLAMDDSMALENFWAKYRGIVLSVCAVLVAVIIIWGGLTYAAEAAEKQVQKEYLRLNDKASRIAFAKRHIKHPMGGLVWMDLAYGYYNQGDYQAAADAYKQAQNSGLISHVIFREQAQLGEAFSILKIDEKKGFDMLEGIAKNSEMMDATRAYAAYELASYAATQKQWQKAKDYVALIKTFSNANPWKRQAEVFAEIYPEMAM